MIDILAQAYGPYGGHKGISLLGGWFPLTLQIVAVVLTAFTLIRFRKRFWYLWVPIALLVGAAVAGGCYWYNSNEGLADDPAPWQLWAWIGLTGFVLVVFLVGWRVGRWWHWTSAFLAIPAAFLCCALVLNQWVGYYSTLQTAWAGITAAPLPGQTDLSALAGMRGKPQSNGVFVPVDTPDTSGFNHRTEYVYLPPAWFQGATPPKLPVIMMIAGEFNTPADWVRSGGIDTVINGYAAQHGGQAPILVLVDAGGTFNNDTECVDGPRGNAADHLTKDVPPYVEQTFGASSDPANWAIVGWSMGGTCALDLTVMHPNLFSTFLDIGGDLHPTAGTDAQTLSRLFGGNQAAMDSYDPQKVMAAHGPYTGVSGVFEDSSPTAMQHGFGRGKPGGTQTPAPAGGAAPTGGTTAAPTATPAPGAPAATPAPGATTSPAAAPAPGGAGAPQWGQAQGGQHAPQWNGKKPDTGSAPAGMGGHDDSGDTLEAGSAETLCPAAQNVGIQCRVITVDSGHTWQFAEAAFAGALPWIASAIGTPGTPPTAMSTVTTTITGKN